MSAAPTIAEALARPHNGFGALRLALALAVVVSHAGSVATGSITDEPLANSTGFTLGEHAVNGFFAVSGFLVTMSYDRRGARDYVAARALRILPGLIAATLVVSLGLGAAMTRLPLGEYYASPDVWRFIERTLTSFKSNTSLPRVFEDNPYRSPLATVWTLKYETFCYLGVLAAGLLGFLQRRWPVALVVIGLAVALVAVETFAPPLRKGIETPLRLPLIFAAGSALYLWRDRLRLTPWPLLAFAAAWLLRDTALYRSTLFLAEAYGAVWLALSPLLARPAFDPPADLSYGTYLYGWPIQQTLHALWPQAPALTMLAASIVLTLGVAAFSWFAVEKPALGFKARLLGRRRLGTIEPAGP